MIGSNLGRALYYATDKNIRDALNEHKVDSSTLAILFHARNTLVSGSAPRKWLAEYFSTLSHDYYDHKNIAAKLGIVSRRERITSVQVTGIKDADAVLQAMNLVKNDLEQHGDTVNVSKSGDRIVLRIDYSVIDYRRSEFNQLQDKDGEIEFHREGNLYVVRNTHNDYVDAVRDLVLKQIESDGTGELTKTAVSLQGVPDPKTRSEFFYDLIKGLSGYLLKDVTDVYVYKHGNVGDDAEGDPHIERVALRGTGVTQTEYLARLAKDGYYIVKVGWRFAEQLGKGSHFAAEALFTNPLDCTGFSYILLGVYDSDGGRVSANRRTPNKVEITLISRAIETKARELLNKISAALKSEASDAK